MTNGDMRKLIPKPPCCKHMLITHSTQIIFVVIKGAEEGRTKPNRLLKGDFDVVDNHKKHLYQSRSDTTAKPNPEK